jgi:hypothetical protein
MIIVIMAFEIIAVFGVIVTMEIVVAFKIAVAFEIVMVVEIGGEALEEIVQDCRSHGRIDIRGEKRSQLSLIQIIDRHTTSPAPHNRRELARALDVHFQPDVRALPTRGPHCVER